MIPFDVKSPLSSDYFSQIFAVIRSIKQQFKERFSLDHNMNDVLDTSLPTADGYHNKLTMPEYVEYDNVGTPSYVPTHLTDSNQIFVKKIDGLHELCVSNDDGIYQLTQNNTIPFTQEPVVNYSGNINISDCSHIQFLNGLFLANSGTKILTSSDGLTWTNRITDISSTYPSLKKKFAYGNGTYVASSNGSDAGTLFSSPDGITWTRRYTSASSYFSLYDVVFANGIFVAVGGYRVNPYNQGTIILTSPDGITWTPRAGAGTGYLETISYGSNIFVAVPRLPQTGTYNYLTSPDGITWTQRYSANLELVIQGNKLNIYFFDGKFFLYNDFSKQAYSTDGITWVSQDSNIQSSSSVFQGKRIDYQEIILNGIHIKKIYYMSYDYYSSYPGTTKKIFSSPDGLIWTEVYTQGYSTDFNYISNPVTATINGITSTYFIHYIYNKTTESAFSISKYKRSTYIKIG